MTQPVSREFGIRGGVKLQDLPAKPYDRHVYGIAAIMRDKLGKLSFRDGSFRELRQDTAQWAGSNGVDVFTVTPDVLQSIAVNPKLRQGINLGQYIPFGNYFTDDTRNAALAHHETIVQAIIRTPEKTFGKRTNG